MVYGKIFTSENNQILDAFAVKDGKFIYVGDKKTLNLLLKTARKLFPLQSRLQGKKVQRLSLVKAGII